MSTEHAAYRDIDGGFTAQALVASGQYPTEISCYGFICQTSEGRRYLIDTDGSSICQSRYALLAQGLPVSDVLVCQSQRTLTLTTRASLLQEARQDLCQELTDQYNDDYFAILTPLLASPSRNTAAPLLERCYQLWLHDAMQLTLWTGLCDLAQQAKLLEPESYQALTGNLAAMPSPQPADHAALRQLTGFAWRDEQGQWQLFADWWPAKALLRQAALTNSGCWVTPVITEYQPRLENNGTRLPALREDFITRWRSAITCEYKQALAEIQGLAPAVSPQLWTDLLFQHGGRLHPLALHSLNGYANRLHLPPLPDDRR